MTDTPEKAIKPRDRGRRCMATTAKSGAPCSNPAMTGLTVCRQHGGAQKSAIEKSERAKVVKDLSEFARPIPTDDARSNPLQALLEEERKTVGRLDWLQSRIGELEDRMLVWERESIERELIGASDTPGENKRVRYVTRINTLVELEGRERKHLLDITKLMLATGFESARMSINAGIKQQTVNVILDAFARIGLDPESEEVKSSIRASIASGSMFRVSAVDDYGLGFDRAGKVTR